MGVGWVLATARWRCPESVVILPVVDLNMPLTLALVWRKDNTSPLLANFIAGVRRLPDVRFLRIPVVLALGRGPLGAVARKTQAGRDGS
jgi:hypothetical protein